MLYLKAYVGALIAFLALDAIWLGLVAKGLYARQLGSLMRDKPDLTAAGLFYLAYVAGVVYLAIAPALHSTNPLRSALVSGAVLGLVAYGTYDMTNYATLKNWPSTLVFVDILWGTVLTATAAACGFWVTRIW